MKFLFIFFFTISQKWPKGKFHREEGFSSGREATISQKKWGLVSFCLNQYKAGIFNGTKRFYNVHSFYVICFLVRTPVNIQFREDIIQDFLYHVFDVFYSARNISLSITD